MDVTDIRSEIDRVDGELLKLFLRRMELIEEIAVCKASAGLPVFDETREREILHRVAENAGARSEDAVALFAMLLELSRQRQQRLLYEAE